MVRKKKQAEKYITLNRINVNAGVVSWYEKQLVALVNLMCKTYEDKILSLYKSNKEQIKEIKYATDDNVGSQYRIIIDKLDRIYSEYFDKKGKQKSEKMVKKVSDVLKTNLEVSFYSFISDLEKIAETAPIRKVLSQFSPEVLNNKKKFIKAFSLKNKMYSNINEQVKKTVITNNVELVKSIQGEYHKKISQSLYDTIINGRPQSELVKAIKEAGVKTRRRASLIARDQVNKTHGILYRQQLKENGVKKAKWVHVGGGKTDRKTHIDKYPKGLNNGIFDLSKGMYDPAVDKYIYPAELPFCRCMAVPIFELGE